MIMLILGIESSCDDTSIALVEKGNSVLSNIISSQIKDHTRYGGVVPEIAARKHLEHILPVLHSALDKADTNISKIDAVAVTHKPGLVGSLIVGLTAAKSIALHLKVPLIGINHLHAHTYAGCLAGLPFGKPHLSLIASGGHTSLLECHRHTYRLIGRTLDDAAGEAYDKIAKHLGLGYPGGPIIDKLAQSGNKSIIRFPRPMIDHDTFDFSFSGLKTAVMYYLHNNPETPPRDLAAAFQDAVIDVLLTKTLKAREHLAYDTISVVGGVAANSALRAAFKESADRTHFSLFIPPPVLCTDNAAMVAGLAYHLLMDNIVSPLNLGVTATADIPLK
ncbi:tRNA (adenosine(37)-N6)-threonylcarbamoyltransferase complex transferase subunit TsaD [bacterium]|nr:tRNA (adenosine(37)-N6)-threonylcarbamoyltransferase complex transferase subunit TsaD [candidate division CSSED10-310 bacterium]